MENPIKKDSNNGVFVIGETGFGTGLNFLTPCDLWLKIAQKLAVAVYFH